MITLQPIDENNYVQAISLKVRPEQRCFVASGEGILARSYGLRNQNAFCRGIYAEEDMVGLLLIHDLMEEPACYHLCELMIDAAHQGKGYGQQALALALEHCRREGCFTKVEVCAHKDAAAAIHLYQKCGFRDTGYTDPSTPDSLILSLTICPDIRYKNIVLRQMQESDIADEIRWNTVETQWSLWDAPWEMEEAVRNFDPEAKTKRLLEFIHSPKPEVPYSLEVDVDGVHIGTVSQYFVDEHYHWISRKDAQNKPHFYTLGIDIAESSYWGRGYGTQALAAWIKYFLDRGEAVLCLQTWSGNARMIHCAQKLGFTECNRETGNRSVRGQIYDGLTFQLDLERFQKYLSENS